MTHQTPRRLPKRWSLFLYQKRSAYGKTIERRADRTVSNAAYYPSRTAVYETESGLTGERYHDKIELRKEYIDRRDRGELLQKPSKQKQDKHFLDSGSYKQGKSYFTIDRKTLDEELRKRVGTGEIKKRPYGSIREFLVFDEPIGKYQDNKGEWREMNVVEVHHSKTGYHGYPRSSKW